MRVVADEFAAHMSSVRHATARLSLDRQHITIWETPDVWSGCVLRRICGRRRANDGYAASGRSRNRRCCFDVGPSAPLRPCRTLFDAVLKGSRLMAERELETTARNSSGANRSSTHPRTPADPDEIDAMPSQGRRTVSDLIAA